MASNCNVCLHKLEAVRLGQRSDLKIVGATNTREDLRNAVGTLDVRVLVVDIDDPEALDAIVECMELRPGLGVVGVTGVSDVKHVIAAQRAGCGQITTKPVDPADLEAAIRRLINDSTDLTQESRAIGVIGAVGGAGASAVSCYLAVALAERMNAKTALIDLDLDFGNAAQAWDLCPTYTIADVASAGTVDRLILEKAAIELPGGVHVLARPATIEQAHAIDETLVGNVIRMARSIYPYLVLDLPRKLDAITGQAFENCDKTVIVLQLTVPAVNNAMRLFEALTSSGLPPERIELVVNRYRKNIHTLSVEAIEKRFKRPVLGTIPNDYRSVAHAMDVGEPVSAKSPMRSAIAEIASSLMGLTAQSESSGWLSRFSLKRRRGAAVDAGTGR